MFGVHRSVEQKDRQHASNPPSPKKQQQSAHRMSQRRLISLGAYIPSRSSRGWSIPRRGWWRLNAQPARLPKAIEVTRMVLLICHRLAEPTARGSRCRGAGWLHDTRRSGCRRSGRGEIGRTHSEVLALHTWTKQSARLLTPSNLKTKKNSKSPPIFALHGCRCLVIVGHQTAPDRAYCAR